MRRHGGIVAAGLAVVVVLFVRNGVTALGQVGPSPAQPLDDDQIWAVVSTLHLDTAAPTPATPNADGTLTVTASGKDVLLPDGKWCLLCPVLDNSPDHAGFEMVQAILVVNHSPIEYLNTQTGAKPYFRLGLPAFGLSIKRVQIIGEDSFHKQIEFMQCNVKRASSGSLPRVQTLQDGGKLYFEVKPSAPIKAVYVFLQDNYVGCLTAEQAKTPIDLRKLPAGDYRFRFVIETADGELCPPSDGSVTIEPRFKITSPAQSEEAAIEKENLTIPVSVDCLTTDEVAKAEVTIDGRPAGEISGAHGECKAPAGDVYSGLAEVTVTGVCKDGVSLPPETINIKLQNYSLNTSPIQMQLDDARQQIADLDKQIVYWYTKAVNDHDIIQQNDSGDSHQASVMNADRFSNNASTSYLSSITIYPGKQAEDFGKCRGAIVERTQARLKLAGLLLKIGRKKAATGQLYRVVREVGAGSTTGGTALAMLRGN